MMCLTSLNRLQPSWPRSVSPVLRLLLVMTGNSKGSETNIFCCPSLLKGVKVFPGCFLRARGWWDFLLHDTTRLTLPVLLLEQTTGHLWIDRNIPIFQHLLRCSNYWKKTWSNWPMKHTPTSFCWNPQFYHELPVNVNTFSSSIYICRQ